MHDGFINLYNDTVQLEPKEKCMYLPSYVQYANTSVYNTYACMNRIYKFYKSF